MSGTAASLLADIAAHGGAIRFDRFMELALYGEDGFYTAPRVADTLAGSQVRSGRAGRRGDFLTSPEVGPLFGAVVARALDAWWHEMGKPDPFVVVDAGAGPGTLARSIIAAQPLCSAALRYVAVEVSAVQRAQHPAGVESRVDLPDGAFTGIVIANELLDNLPFRLFVSDSGWKEAYVAYAGGRLVEILRTCDELPSVLPTVTAHGARVAVCERATTWVRDVLNRLDHGRLLAIDYCTTTAAMASRPWREWLRTYAHHERGSHYLSAAGSQDITVDVPLDQLPTPSAVSTQVQFLLQHGIESLVADGRAAWSTSAAAPTLHSMTMRSRVREAESLLDPNGLGAFRVVEWRR
mgnify:CR=1 FL=1